MKVIVNSKQINLTDNDYLAKGGQGTIYLKNNLVFKIYHDISNLIPENKILELQSLKHLTNVIIPSDSIIDEDKHQRIGFVMNYIKDTEYLCKLFVSSFKNDNNISDKDIMNLVENMQKTLINIHKENILVGDYNEMNFLVSKDFKIPYYIDVDSYQTKSYKCNAIMESVRDPLLPLGKFNEMSDWFSFAIVTFQLYTGIHPFKGKHPDYKGNELSKRMNDCISVFDKDVAIPKFINFNSIPKNHLEWYKKVFINKERSVPPLPNEIIAQQVSKTVIDNTGNIEITLLNNFNSYIIDIVDKGNVIYALTKEGVFKDNLNVLKGKFNNGKIIFTNYMDLLVVYIENDFIKVKNDQEIIFEKKLENSKFKVFNEMIYEINESGVIQYSLEKFGNKIKFIPKFISPVNYNSSQIFEGVFIDNLFGKYNTIIPFSFDDCIKIKTPELNEYRILDAKRIEKWLFVIGEKKGIVSLFYFKFENRNYECKIEENIDFRNLNVIIKSNGIVILNKEDDVLEIFSDFSKNKVIGNTPIRNNLKMIKCLNNTCFIDKNNIYSIKMK